MKHSPKLCHSAGIILSVLGLLCAAIAPMGCEDEDSKPNAPTPLPATHTVTFDLNGGQGKVNTLIVPSGQKAQEPSEAPTREDYTFEGWLTDKDAPDALYDFSAPVAADIALYAYWKKVVTYTVTFDVKGGEGTLDPQTVKEGDLIARPPPPIQQGYSFEGWFADDDTFQSVFDFKTLITSDTTLYAKWELIPEKFRVPDANFRKALKELLPDAFDLFDSLITNRSSVTQLTFLDVSRLSIADLTGIEYFTALDILMCSYNQLKELDVSKNTALTRLECHHNQLTSLNLSQHTALTALTVFPNALTDLDIRGMRSISFLPGITSLPAEPINPNSDPNPLTKLLVHENLQDDIRIKRAKADRGDALTIETYSAEPGSTDYTLACGDYDPHAETCLSSTPLASFTVDFQFNDGREITSRSVYEGKLAAKPRAPTRKGYAFGRWFTDNAFQNAFDFTNPVTGDLILYAKWIKEHTVTFDLSQGQGSIPSQTVQDGKLATVPTVPDRPGYIIRNWFTDKAYQDVFDFTDAVTGDLILYARWEQRLSYTVTFDLNGGDGTLDPQTVQEGDMASSPQPPTRQDYSFQGWFTDKAFQQAFDFTAPITGNVILYAQWETTAKFWVPDNNFRRQLKALIPDAFDPLDSLITNHIEVIQLTRLFLSWYRPGSPSQVADLTGIEFFTSLTHLDCRGNRLTHLDLSHNIRLELLFCSRNLLSRLELSKNRALENLDCTSNLLDSLHLSQNTALDQLYAFSNPLVYLDIRGMRTVARATTLLIRKNYAALLKVHEDIQDHKGIKDVKSERGNALTIETYRASAGSTDYTLECGDYNPHAETCSSSTPLTSFTRSFEANGGSKIAPQSVYEGKPVAAPTNPTRKGYAFGGWFTDKAFQNAFDFSTPVTGDLILYAKWLKEHTVTFDLSQGQGSIPSQTVQDGELATLPTPPDRSGYIIRNWFTDKAYQDVFDFSTPVTSDLILYARWEQRLSYTVTFDLNGGDGTLDPQTVQEGGTATEPSRPTRSGYTFLGWSTANTPQYAFEFTAPVTGNVILYARWAAVKKFWVPDANFRKELKTLVPDAFDLFDSLITNHIDVQWRTILRLNSASIADLTGVEYFTSLTHLFCSKNDLTVLDVSKNTRLERLDCGYNDLTRLDLSQNTALKILDCRLNSLDSLHLWQNTALNRLYTLGNELVYMDIRGMRTVYSGRSLSINFFIQPYVLTKLTTLKVHENIKNHNEIKVIKTRRGDALKIETYRAEPGSTDYTLECDDYDPNAGSCNTP